MQVSKTMTAMSKPSAPAVPLGDTLLVGLLDATNAPQALPMTTATRWLHVHLVRLVLLRLKVTLGLVPCALQASMRGLRRPNVWTARPAHPTAILWLPHHVW
jgi:hypothetical protein